MKSVGNYTRLLIDLKWAQAREADEIVYVTSLFTSFHRPTFIGDSKTTSNHPLPRSHGGGEGHRSGARNLEAGLWDLERKWARKRLEGRQRGNKLA
jgi:hypothetical protein